MALLKSGNSDCDNFDSKLLVNLSGAYQGCVLMAVQVSEEEAGGASAAGCEEGNAQQPAGCIVLQERADCC